jgi:cytidylate kinase
MSTNAGVALGGPTGSGKTSVGRKLAELLGYDFISSGYFYRAGVIAMGDIPIESFPNELGPLLGAQIVYSPDQRVTVNGFDVTGQLNDVEVSVRVPHLARIPAVRHMMNSLQRGVIQGSHGRLLIEGRNVKAETWSEVRVSLEVTASVQARAERRLAQLIAQGVVTSLPEIEAMIAAKDKVDRDRETFPMKDLPVDALVVDSSNLSFDETVTALHLLAKKALAV